MLTVSHTNMDLLETHTLEPENVPLAEDLLLIE